MALCALRFREPHSGLARRQLLSRSLLHVGRGGFSRCLPRRENADGPHGSTSTAYDVRASIDLVGSTSAGNVTPPAGCVPAVPVAAARKAREHPREPSGLLACRRRRVGGLACSGAVSAG